MKKIHMKALMSIPTLAVKRGDTFEADAQTARDLEQAGRAERARSEPAQAKAKT